MFHAAPGGARRSLRGADGERHEEVERNNVGRVGTSAPVPSLWENLLMMGAETCRDPAIGSDRRRTRTVCPVSRSQTGASPRRCETDAARAARPSLTPAWSLWL